MPMFKQLQTTVSDGCIDLETEIHNKKAVVLDPDSHRVLHTDSVSGDAVSVPDLEDGRVVKVVI